MARPASTLHFRVMSALLLYPEQELIDALPELDVALDGAPGDIRARLAPVLTHLASDGLIPLQESYVDTFDRGRKFSLHLFEHLHGESRERGPALVDLMQAYREHGFVIDASELPDYLPLFLEFLGSVPMEVAQSFLDDAIHVIAEVGKRLSEIASPYACVFDVLVMLAGVVPRPLVQPPVRDMDEAMETFGPSRDGVEPLLKEAAQTVRFYPRGAAPHAVGGHRVHGKAMTQ